MREDMWFVWSNASEGNHLMMLIDWIRKQYLTYQITWISYKYVFLCYLSYWSSKPSMHLPSNKFLFHFDIKYFIKKILLSLRCIKYWTDSIIEFIMVHHNRQIISNLSWLLWWFNTILATVDSFCFHQHIHESIKKCFSKL